MNIPKNYSSNPCNMMMNMGQFRQFIEETGLRQTHYEKPITPHSSPSSPITEKLKNLDLTNIIDYLHVNANEIETIKNEQSESQNYKK